MAKRTAALVSLAFAATVAATGWASAQVSGARTPPSGGGQSRGTPSGPPASSAQGRSGSPGGPGRGAPPPGSPTGARNSAGHAIIGHATPNPAVGHGYYTGYPGYCCGYYGGYYGGYYPYYPYYYSPWAFGLGFGWYGGYWPYGYYDGYYPAYDAPGGGGNASAPSHPTGSIRLKVNPETASVYIDGGLVGKAGDFDGLTSHHLVLEGGSHLVEIRADGYETFNKTLMVEIGKTMTERLTLKRK